MVALAKKMIAAGANPNAKNNNGQTPLQYAKSKKAVVKKRYKTSEDKVIKYLESLQ